MYNNEDGMKGGGLKLRPGALFLEKGARGSRGGICAKPRGFNNVITLGKRRRNGDRSPLPEKV